MSRNIVLSIGNHMYHEKHLPQCEYWTFIIITYVSGFSDFRSLKEVISDNSFAWIRTTLSFKFIKLRTWQETTLFVEATVIHFTVDYILLLALLPEYASRSSCISSLITLIVTFVMYRTFFIIIKAWQSDKRQAYKRRTS